VCPTGNRTLQTNAAIWTLAQDATDADLEALAAGEVPNEAFRDFLEQYGSRSEASWEIMATRWRQDPSKLLPLIRAQIGGDPAVREIGQEAAFQEAFDELRRAVPTGLRRVTLEWMIPMVRQYLLLRENQRFWFDQLLFSIQESLLWIGGSFAKQGILTEADDIAYLTWPEVQGIVSGTLTTEAVAGWVARRRAQRQEDAAVTPPVFLVGDESGAVDDAGGRLQGLGISPGRVRGTVRIVHRLSDVAKLKPGEILVTRSVDPGWTPLFSTAAGLILEMGSLLSHGAVVAREYKIPAVVNIDGVIGRLRDGDEVTVDGTRGVVWVHP
jgi:pyruvate,water dikinase